MDGCSGIVNDQEVIILFIIETVQVIIMQKAQLLVVEHLFVIFMVMDLSGEDKVMIQTVMEIIMFICVLLKNHSTLHISQCRLQDKYY